MSEELSKQASKIGPSLQGVANETRKAINEAVEHAPEHASRWYGQAKEQAKHLGEMTRDQARHLKDVSAEQYEVIRGHVERHAMVSTLVAFAAGFVVARFLFRR